MMPASQQPLPPGSVPVPVSVSLADSDDDFGFSDNFTMVAASVEPVNPAVELTSEQTMPLSASAPVEAEAPTCQHTAVPSSQVPEQPGQDLPAPDPNLVPMSDEQLLDLDAAEMDASMDPHGDIVSVDNVPGEPSGASDVGSLLMKPPVPLPPSAPPQSADVPAPEQPDHASRPRSTRILARQSSTASAASAGSVENTKAATAPMDDLERGLVRVFDLPDLELPNYDAIGYPPPILPDRQGAALLEPVALKLSAERIMDTFPPSHFEKATYYASRGVGRPPVRFATGCAGSDGIVGGIMSIFEATWAKAGTADHDRRPVQHVWGCEIDAWKRGNALEHPDDWPYKLQPKQYFEDLC